MKKKNLYLQNNENVIMFPGTVETLITDGLAYAEKNNYIKAAACFDEAKKFIKLDDMILSVYILTLLETRRTKEAREICEDLMREKSPAFEQIVELYLTILLDLKEYKALNQAISYILSEYQFSNERKVNFHQLLELSNRLIGEKDIMVEDGETEVEKLDSRAVQYSSFVSLTFVQQEQMLQQAFYQNISEAIEDIKKIAESTEVVPTIQTLALLLLGSAGVVEMVNVTKFGHQLQVSPAKPPTDTAVDRMEVIEKIVQEKLEKDPTKQAMTNELIHRHAYALFPLDWKGYDDEQIAESYATFVDTLFTESSVESNDLLDLILKIELSLQAPENQ